MTHFKRAGDSEEGSITAEMEPMLLNVHVLNDPDLKLGVFGRLDSVIQPENFIPTYSLLF